MNLGLCSSSVLGFEINFGFLGLGFGVWDTSLYLDFEDWNLCLDCSLCMDLRLDLRVGIYV